MRTSTASPTRAAATGAGIILALTAALRIGSGLVSWHSLQIFALLFLAIFMEAFPFLVLGALVAALMHRFVSEETIRRIIPKGPLAGHLIAGALGLAFPLCECGIVPVMRGLVRKGLPPSVAVTFMAAVPIVNPLVALSTYVAFHRHIWVVALRLGLGFAVAVISGLAARLLGVDSSAVLRTAPHEGPCGHDHGKKAPVIAGLLESAGTELFDTARFLVIGALLAAVFQVIVPRGAIAELKSTAGLATLGMMGFAYFSSLCSEADAFVAVSLRGCLPFSALMAFVVYGPMMDIKNTLMLYGSFKRRYALTVLIVVTIIAAAANMGLALFLPGGWSLG